MLRCLRESGKMYSRTFNILHFIVRDKVHHGSKKFACFIGPAALSVHPKKTELSYSRYQQVRLVQLCRQHANTSQPPGSPPDSKGGGAAEAPPTQPASATARLKEAVIKVMPRKKVKFDTSHPSTERNFITAVRAMAEFLLKPSDLENLRKTKRRSPFENEPPITVYWRKDVEEKAIQVWGSIESLEKEKMKREKEVKQYKENIFNVKRIMKEYRRDQRSIPEPLTHEANGKDISGNVVWTAVAINGANLVMKLGAWAFTGSHSLFAEALHSLADVTNQLILAYGIHKSKQRADVIHPYGYTTMRYVSSLISGAMIFCVGAGLSFQHGISGLMAPSEVLPLYWAFYILGGSLITEGGTLLMAAHAIRKGAQHQQMSFTEYVLRSQDPSVNVVLLEDMAAVIGVSVAMACMGLTSITGSHIPDAIGSCLIGGILAGVSGFIIYTNSAALVGKSIPQYRLEKINDELERDVLIRAIYDVKGIDMGTGLVRYKAEVDFDGRELTRGYLDKQDLDAIMKEIQAIKTVDEVEAFMLKHGENIVDSLGAEVDRIEKTLKKAHPEIRHCDLEIL
ncbi:zinc transporter 9-like isoform X3 [Penaeus monodon]|uniref:zinc transporter 9-like isoform X3 n=2 Tax=Penaeus monodon TaxID=6687 RepID=UPI0018A6E77A|nr:zinc transporter 9-like isoform X3 [Penaeus monodon]